MAGGLLIALVTGLRYQVGADWPAYENMFSRIRHFSLEQALAYGDPAFALLNWVGAALGFEVWFPNLVCAGIFAWGLLRFTRLQPDPWLALVIAVPYLVTVVAMGYTRQGAAIGLIFAALAAFEKRSLGRFIIFIIIATAFHKTAVLVVPLTAAAATRNRLALFLLLMLLSIALYFAFLEASMDKLVENYIDAEYQSQGAAIRVMMNVGPALIFLLAGERLASSDVQLKIWRNFSWAALLMVVLLFAISSSTAVDRMALYIIPLQIFVLSRLPYGFGLNGKANSELLLLVIIYSAAIQFVWLNYAAHAEYWLPYRFYPLAA